jgi:hypothetical protein
VYALSVGALLTDRADECPEHPVLQAHRIVQLRLEMRLEELEIGVVTIEADRACLRDDPVQRFIGETIWRGASTYVGMHAGEPGLFEVPGPDRRPCPERRLKRRAMLVDCERVISVQDVVIQTDIVIRVLVSIEHAGHAPNDSRGAQGPDRIPYSYERDRRTGSGVLDVVKRLGPFGIAWATW